MVDWVTILITLLGGGAMGAIITISVSSYMNKIQPVGKRVIVDKIFQFDEKTDPNVQGVLLLCSRWKLCFKEFISGKDFYYE
jgi:hypothetical protein